MRFLLFIYLGISLHLDAGTDPLRVFIDKSDYAGLFIVSSGATADSIMKAEMNSGKLEHLVLDQSASLRTRFFSSEILFRYSKWKPDSSSYRMLSRIYANALKENYTLRGNPWGTTSGLGVIGKRMVIWEKESVKALLPLLRNEKRLDFAGSHTATIALENKMRVKDIAAMCISKIIGFSFKIADKIEERDAAIKKIRRLAKKYCHN